MIRCNKLALGFVAISVAAFGLLGTPAFAGNNGHNHNHVHNHHNHNFHGHNHNFQFHSNQFVQRPVQVIRVDYRVLVRQPDRYGDYDWHLVDTFSSLSRADLRADYLNSRFQHDPGFAVKVVRYTW